MQHAPMSRCRYVQENRKMRFEEAYQGWTGGRLTQAEAALLLGQCAQAGWGEWGTIAVGYTRRRLSFFLMVLCYSRRMYLEFTVSQKMEFFLACHETAFAVFGGVPRRHKRWTT